MMKKISMGEHSEIILSEGILFDPGVAAQIQRLGARFALICDENLAALGKQWRTHLEGHGLSVILFTFPSGEQEKSRERKAALEDQLLAQKCGRDTCIIALGGGVTTDLVGYLASTYCRGVPLVFAPTTLLGMVDASIGGKTGVNTSFGKNLIGTYYPADIILVDPKILSTLPPSEWTSGLAEVVKYALIRSPLLAQMLRTWNPKDPAYLEKILHECISIKAQVVEIDFEEKLGLRRILNFGHTIAHALELVENYRLSHGEAVAIGMLVETFISVRMGYLPESALKEIEGLIRSFPFALKFSAQVTPEKMKEALSLDKKTAKGAVRFVLLEKIGSCKSFDGEYCTSIPQKTLDEAMHWMFAQCSGGST